MHRHYRSSIFALTTLTEEKEAVFFIFFVMFYINYKTSRIAYKYNCSTIIIIFDNDTRVTVSFFRIVINFRSEKHIKRRIERIDEGKKNPIQLVYYIHIHTLYVSVCWIYLCLFDISLLGIEKKTSNGANSCRGIHTAHLTIFSLYLLLYATKNYYPFTYLSFFRFICIKKHIYAVKIL